MQRLHHILPFEKDIWFLFSKDLKKSCSDWIILGYKIIAVLKIILKIKDVRIHNLEVKIKELLGQWLFNLLTKNEVWQAIPKRKYIDSRAWSQVDWKLGDSHFLPLWHQKIIEIARNQAPD
jgi:hypothetical protein